MSEALITELENISNLNITSSEKLILQCFACIEDMKSEGITYESFKKEIISKVKK